MPRLFRVFIRIIVWSTSRCIAAGTCETWMASTHRASIILVEAGDAVIRAFHHLGFAPSRALRVNQLCFIALHVKRRALRAATAHISLGSCP
jgi:hypothetical protein